MLCSQISIQYVTKTDPQARQAAYVKIQTDANVNTLVGCGKQDARARRWLDILLCDSVLPENWRICAF